MDVKIERLPKSEVTLTIAVEAKEYQSYLEKAAVKLSREIKIEGFRPGKVPYHIIKQRLGEGEIMNESLGDIITHTFIDAISKEKLNTVGQPEINVKKMAPGNTLVYEAKVIIVPEVKLPDISQVKIEKSEVKVEDDEVNKTLEHLAKSRAAEILENRPAKNKDVVKLDYNISIDNVPQEGGQQKDFAVHLGEKHMVPGFEEQILGLKAGDRKKFDITFPKDYFQKNFANKKCQFEVNIKGVYKLEISSIDDEFAKSLGDFKDLKDLTGKIKENIKLDKEQKQEKELENKMFDELIKKTEFTDIPNKLIENEIDIMLNEIKGDLEMKGLKFDIWLENMNKKEDELKKDFQPQAERRVKSALILRKLAETEKIKAEDKHIKEEIKKIKDIYKDNSDITKRIESSEYYDYLMNSLTSQKVVEFLKKKIIK